MIYPPDKTLSSEQCIEEINCTIRCIMMYPPVDSAIHLLNNWTLGFEFTIRRIVLSNLRSSSIIIINSSESYG